MLLNDPGDRVNESKYYSYVFLEQETFANPNTGLAWANMSEILLTWTVSLI